MTTEVTKDSTTVRIPVGGEVIVIQTTIDPELLEEGDSYRVTINRDSGPAKVMRG